MRRALLAVALCVVTAYAHAAEDPRPGNLDYRVRSTDFADGQVYRITGFFGFHAIVLFGAEEAIQKVSGYESGWNIESLGNKILISPKLADADSNLTVVTNRHVYFFDLSVKPFPKGRYISQARDARQTYGLHFRYPEDERIAAASKSDAERAEARLREASAAAGNKAKHWNYTYMGAEAIRPYEVWDDGTFTYFKFYAQQDLPTLFVVNDDGTESVVNKGMERDSDTMVVQRVGKEFRLRMGNSVVCIYNENPAQLSPSSPTQTSSDQVQRLIRGESK